MRASITHSRIKLRSNFEFVLSLLRCNLRVNPKRRSQHDSQRLPTTAFPTVVSQPPTGLHHPNNPTAWRLQSQAHWQGLTLLRVWQQLNTTYAHHIFRARSHHRFSSPALTGTDRLPRTFAALQSSLHPDNTSVASIESTANARWISRSEPACSRSRDAAMAPQRSNEVGRGTVCPAHRGLPDAGLLARGRP
jgi:hypothetical protein